MAAPRRPVAPVWLHATDPDLTPALRVLAGVLADQPERPPTRVTGDARAPGPGDDLRSMDAAFDAFAPRLLVLAGSLLPGALIDRARARGVALMLVDATDPAPRGGWRLFPGHGRALLSRFCQIHARDPEAAAAIARRVKGAVPVFDPGALARHAPAPGCNAQELDALRAGLGARPVWLAQGLPATELDAVLLAHGQALRRAHRLLLILEPADPALGDAMAARAIEAGFVCAQRAREDEVHETTQVYIADAGDAPGLFLRLAPVCFLGGSLSRGVDTPSPVMAAALGSALVFGPYAGEGERPFLDRLRAAGGGRQIVAPADLGPAVSALLAPDAGAEAALRAWTLATEGSEASLAVARAICDWLVLNGDAA